MFDAQLTCGGVAKGAYVLKETQGRPDLILMATGAEVHLALKACRALEEKGIAVRVVNMPSWELFEKRSQSDKDSLLPPDVTARLAVEAGMPMGWERYVGSRGAVIGVSGFGASAPGGVVLENFGFTEENVVAQALKVLNG